MTRKKKPPRLSEAHGASVWSPLPVHALSPYGYDGHFHAGILLNFRIARYVSSRTVSTEASDAS